MELEKIISDTRNLSDHLYSPELLGSWEPGALVVDLVGETGTLARSVLIMEGIAAHAPEDAHLQLDLTRLLYMLTHLSNVYHVDLERAWNDLMQQSAKNLANLEKRLEKEEQEKK